MPKHDWQHIWRQEDLRSQHLQVLYEQKNLKEHASFSAQKHLMGDSKLDNPQMAFTIELNQLGVAQKKHHCMSEVE